MLERVRERERERKRERKGERESDLKYDNYITRKRVKDVLCFVFIRFIVM